MPRRHAFPRTAELDTAAVLHHTAATDICISATASVESPQGGWINAVYAPLGAKLHMTVLQLKTDRELAEAIANRAERMALNTGGAVARTDTYTTESGWQCRRITVGDGVSTPVQFLAVSPDRRLASGVFILDGNTSPADSLRPIVHQLDDEAMRITQSLK